MIWNETMECMPLELKRKLQSERLRRVVEHVYHNTPFYRKKMQELGLSPNDIQSIEDITKLPFTTKQDLRDNYPFGLFAVPMSEIVRLHASSGTTGKPTVVGYTRNDLDIWSECLARCFTAYGLNKNDIFQISYGYGLFTGGMGVHYGVEKLGGTVIPMSSGNTAKQIQIMHDFGTTVLACTPSYALYLAEALRDSSYPRREFKLRAGVFGAEPWTEEMRKEIEGKLGIKAFDIYGLSEVIGPGVAHSCECQNGSHIADDYFFPEVVDSKTLQPVEDGVQGELVFTTLTKEGLPMLRYRTKDLTSIITAPCECGRTNVKMTRIMGRSDDMLIIRGVNVFPSQFESILAEMKEFTEHFMLYVDRVNNLDTLELHVELVPECYTDDMSKLMGLKKKLTSRLQSVIGLSVNVKLVEPRSIPRSEGKMQRVVDKRKML